MPDLQSVSLIVAYILSGESKALLECSHTPALPAEWHSSVDWRKHDISCQSWSGPSVLRLSQISHRLLWLSYSYYLARGKLCWKAPIPRLCHQNDIIQWTDIEMIFHVEVEVGRLTSYLVRFAGPLADSRIGIICSGKRVDGRSEASSWPRKGSDKEESGRRGFGNGTCWWPWEGIIPNPFALIPLMTS